MSKIINDSNRPPSPTTSPYSGNKTFELAKLVSFCAGSLAGRVTHTTQDATTAALPLFNFIARIKNLLPERVTKGQATDTANKSCDIFDKMME